MIKVGLTGNLGSGKSTIAKIFQVLGVPVYHADDASKAFLDFPVVKDKITGFFGTGILTPEGKIDRRLLGQTVFSDHKALAYLNSILHPLVREDARKWNQKHAGYTYIIHEAAIIYESGFQNEYDRIIHVSCPPEIAVSRAMKRDHASREEILGRTRFQMNDDEKARLADYVIVNDGTLLVLPQVIRLHKLLIDLATAGKQQ